MRDVEDRYLSVSRTIVITIIIIKQKDGDSDSGDSVESASFPP